jgi:MscS family membrane protein
MMRDVLTHNVHLQALFVLLAALIAAALFDWLMVRYVSKLVRRTRFELDDQLVALLRRPVAASFILVGCSMALRAERLPMDLGLISQSVIATLAILIWLTFGIRTSRLILTWAAHREGHFRLIQPTSLPAFDIAAKLIFFALGSYLIMSAWRIDLTAWLASAGIIGIAVGFAAKDSLANLFAGLFILADSPYRVGDFIVLDNERGQVTRIGLRSTRILTRDDIEITIPNATIANSKIINESGGPSIKQRLRVPVGVAYDSDIDLVRSVLQEVADNNPHVSQEPAPRVRFRSFGDSSLNFELLCWINSPLDRGQALDSLNTAIFKSFRDARVEIPFPKRDVYIKQVQEQQPTRLAPQQPD